MLPKRESGSPQASKGEGKPVAHIPVKWKMIEEGIEQKRRADANVLLYVHTTLSDCILYCILHTVDCGALRDASTIHSCCNVTSCRPTHLPLLIVINQRRTVHIGRKPGFSNLEVKSWFREHLL